jgi:hypothetical protein
MTLIDTYMPAFTYTEYHDIVVAASPGKAYRAARFLDFSTSRTIRVLFKLRGLPTDSMTIEGFTERVGFTMLEEHPGNEFVIGFWARHGIERIPSPEAFIHGGAMRLKAAWNFSVEPLVTGKARVSTETRVLCMTKPALVTFSLYWAVVRPFSGLIRKKMLHLIKLKAEGK